MIANSNDLFVSLNQLKAEIPEVGNISDKLSSSDFNDIMNNVSSYLDALYEKTRILSDVYDYTKAFIDKEIDEKRLAFENNFKITERQVDSYIDTNNVAKEVPLNNCQEKVYDNDGQQINEMEIYDTNLEASGAVLNKAYINYVDKDSDCIPFSASEKIKENGSSATCYLLDEPQKIVENYKIYFDKPERINYINLRPINAEIKNMVAIAKDDDEIDIEHLGYQKEMYIKSLQFSLVCNSYDTELTEGNYDAYKDLSLKKDKKNKSKSVQEEKARMSDVEKLSELGMYRGKYSKWEDASQKAEFQNESSSDDVIGTVTTEKESKKEIYNTYIRTSSGSIIAMTTGTSFHYIPSERVETKNIVSGKYISDPQDEYRHEPYLMLRNVYKYVFGFDKLCISKKKINEECGYVSPEVNVKGSTGIALSVDTDNFVGTEFYIIDGLDEKSVIPVEQDQILEEKLTGPSTRFKMDESQPFTILCNDEISVIKELDGIDFTDGNEYKINYYPVPQNLYIPSKDTVKVKIIQRKNDVPPIIKAATIKTYGGELDWTVPTQG